jgi:photosystem II stability/assembly factor-like uncharacterized protein
MKIKSKTLLSLAFMLSTALTQAQPWMASVKSAQSTFKELQTAFNEYWKNKPIERGQGYKAFKRWEWFWQSRLLPDGSFPSPSINFDELNKYKKTHPAKAKIKAANWEFKGPTTSVGGYFGLGRINTMAFHPTDINTFWVGTPSGGLWKTTDGGSTWSSNTDNLGVLGISGIAIDPTNPNVMYIATGDGDSYDTFSMGVLKSTDGGNTWSKTGLNLPVAEGYIIRRLVMSPANPQILFAATNGGLVRTEDGFTNFTGIEGFFSDVEFHPTNPNIVYAASHNNFKGYIHMSTNAGVSWKAVDSIPSIGRINLEVSPAAPDVVHALCANSSGGFAGIWSSTDKGVSFVRTLAGTTTNNILHSSSNGSGSGGQGYYDLAFAINPSNANQIWAGGINTWMSSDGGVNWTLKNYWTNSSSVPNIHADKHFLAFHPLSPTTLFECNDGGLYKTTNGGATWTNLSNGLGISQVYRMGLSVTNADRVLAGLQDNSTKKLINGAWSEAVPTGDGFESIVDYNNSNIMYTSSYYGNLMKSTNGGTNWTDITLNDGTGADEQGPWLTPYVMHPTTSTTLLMGKSQVYQTIDGGTTWTRLSTLPAASGQQVSAIAYAPSNPQTIYVATNTNSGNRVYKTTNGGTTWSQIVGATLTNSGTGASTPTQFISGLAVHPFKPQQVWITQSGYTAGNKVWTTTDGGTTWSNSSGTLPNIPANCIVYQNGSNDGLYIGTDVGVFYRDNDETDWVPYQNGLPNVVVNELEISYSDKKLWAATYGRGLWNTDMNMSTPCTAPAVPTSGGNKVVCQSETPVTLTATPPTGATIDWYNASTGGTLLQAGSNSLSVNANGNYYAEARNTTNNCKSATRILVMLTVTPTPTTPTVATSGSTALCTGSSVTLTSSATSGNQWYNNGTAITGATGTTYVATTAGIYTVKTTSGACISNASTNTLVTVTPIPAQPVITQNGGVLQSSAASGNQWYFNGTLLPLNATSQTYTPTATGEYTVVATVNGCASPASTPFPFAITAINSPELDNQLVIAPNPVSSKLAITYKGNAARFQISLLDFSGKQVLAQSTFTTSYTLDMSSFSAGPYIIRITNERSKEHVQRVIMKQ